MIEFRKLQEKYKLSASELIKKLVFREVPLTIKKINFAVLENKK